MEVICKINCDQLIHFKNQHVLELTDKGWTWDFFLNQLVCLLALVMKAISDKCYVAGH